MSKKDLDPLRKKDWQDGSVGKGTCHQVDYLSSNPGFIRWKRTFPNVVLCPPLACTCSHTQKEGKEGKGNTERETERERQTDRQRERDNLKKEQEKET